MAANKKHVFELKSFLRDAIKLEKLNNFQLCL